MKSLFKKIILFSLTCIVTLGLLFSNKEMVSAHPFYYDSNNNPVECSWYDVSDGTAHLKVAQYNLSSGVSKYFSTSVDAWPSVTDAVETTITTTAYSNVDLTTPSMDAWKKLTGVKYQQYVAVTMTTTTDNVNVISTSDILNSQTKVFKYALIYFNPEEMFIGTNDNKKASIVHELGHALGLGHTNDGPDKLDIKSIMNKDEMFKYYLPQAHDITDIEAKY